MKAIVYDRFGGPEVLQVRDVPQPVPGPREVLVKVFAAPVTSGDVRLRAQDAPSGFGFLMKLMFGFYKPRFPILGNSFAGEIVSVGASVTRFRRGEMVFGSAGMKMGTHAEYLVVPEAGSLARMPTDVSVEVAASMPFGGLTALTVSKKAQFRPGMKVLVNGASGAVGRMVVQLASAAGATVTGVCGAARSSMVLKLGAVEVLDYAKTDVTTLARRFDVIVDTTGKLPFPKARNLMEPAGQYCAVLVDSTMLPHILWSALKRDGKLVGIMAEESRAAMEELRQLVEDGKITNPVSDVLTFEDAARAHGLVQNGKALGAVVLIPGRS